MTAISAHILQQAIELYLTNAYPAGAVAIPAVVQERIRPIRQLAPTDDVPQDLLEKENTVSKGGYALRLGQPLYPHMKLIIEDAPASPGESLPPESPRILLRVDSHDSHLHAPPGSPDAAWLAAIRASNREITDRIEGAWTQAHLPTFKEFLRVQLDARKARHH